MINQLQESMAFAIQSAVLEMVELAVVTVEGGDYQADALEDEIQDTVVSMVAAILIQEDGLHDNELAFIKRIMVWNKTAISKQRIIADYAERWAYLSKVVPQFVCRAAHFDRTNQTSHASAMLRFLQSIGNNAVIADGGAKPGERKIIRDYICFLENSLTTI